LFLSINALPVAALTNRVYIPKRTYNKVALLGPAEFDSVHIRNQVLTNQQIIDSNQAETFDTHTIFLANFEDTLAAGNYVSLENPIVKWRVKRKLLGNFKPIVLQELDAEQTSYVDFTQSNKREYEYQVIPITADGTEGSPLTTLTSSDFFGWFLCDEHNTTVYKFDLNVVTDAIVFTTDVSLFEGYTKYPIQREGKRRYHSGSLTTVPYSYRDSEIRIDNSMLREIEEFITDGKTKILKNSSGDVFKVQTSEFSYQYMDTTIEQAYTISFKWIEVGAVE